LIFGKKYLKKKGGKNEGKKERRKRNEEHYKQQQFHRLTLRLKQRKIKITKETTPHHTTPTNATATFPPVFAIKLWAATNHIYFNLLSGGQTDTEEQQARSNSTSDFASPTT
jgi:hypothetical protein